MTDRLKTDTLQRHDIGVLLQTLVSRYKFIPLSLEFTFAGQS